METLTTTSRPFSRATNEVLIGNLEAAIAFNASPTLIAQLATEIELRKAGK